MQIGEDRIAVNGIDVSLDTLGDTLAPLMTHADDIVVLKADETASLQRLVDVAVYLEAAGYPNIAIVE